MDNIVDRRRRFAEAARGDRPDLALLCLLVGAEAAPGLDETAIAGALDELDRLADDVARQRTGDGPGAWARAMTEVLGGRHGFRGLPSDYRRLESSLLHHVLRRRRGLPILLSVVWIEVGRRLGAPVYGVGLPGHFVVGIGAPDGGHVLVDPFSGGRQLAAGDAELLVAGALGSTGVALSAGMFAPAEPLDIVARVLNNIRAWAAARPEHSAVQLWAIELGLLLPHHPAGLRLERAQLLVQRGEFAAGAAEMESYAESVTAMDPAIADGLRQRARSARALLN
ncbi:SirB1 family protein [Streptantibioticus rubrisoli]|uniref:Transglutaminase-like domain-containing protein n=1 Tax=Streptantibioticus rubrisoli TaxID=1387313 RepID=A0ABT1PF33_9ACTN|nr:transglutaminase-like domain-containing protein [Streptantibioticus rubrisoli]MCQ4043991.1 transglutaminase-like domain-containing protein [Streptantibioticus rubrisoli]